MGDHFELKEIVTVEELKDKNNTVCDHLTLSVQFLNEKSNQNLDIANTKTTTLNPPVVIEEITMSVEKNEFAEFNENQDRREFIQTPDYQQQGRPPQDAARMYGPYRTTEHYGDGEAFRPSAFGDTFDDMLIRNRFIQRVYTILAFQLIGTFGFICLCMFSPAVKKFVLTNFVLLIVFAVVQICVYFILVCCKGPRRNFPINFILLGIFTVAFGYLMAAVSVMGSTYIVLTSIGITAAVCLLISMIACCCSIDITTSGIYLAIAGLIVMIFGMAAIIVFFVTGSNIMFIIYAGMIALLFSMYLLYDTQMIIGGKRIELSPEEYIFGALCLYIDIMQIFWAILMILSRQ